MGLLTPGFPLLFGPQNKKILTLKMFQVYSQRKQLCKRAYFIKFDIVKYNMLSSYVTLEKNAAYEAVMSLILTL